MARRGYVDDQDLPGDSPERLKFALDLREGLTPSGVIEDWGDYNNDYPDYCHDRANGKAHRRDRSGLGVSSLEEVQTYYDQGNSADLDITLLGEK
jgi:hypothetical protein